jgi:hypothetical protein
LFSHIGSRAALLYALDRRGLRLVAENGQTVLRRRRDGDAPVPLPAPVAAPAAVNGEVGP